MAHKAQLSITNNTKYTLTYQYGWFAAGGPQGPPYSFPATIAPNSGPSISNWESGYQGTTLSGYAIYMATPGNIPITFAFSNPAIGTNKLGVGIASGNGQGGNNSVYENMSSHDYNPFQEFFSVFVANCSCTDGDLNYAKVSLDLVV